MMWAGAGRARAGGREPAFERAFEPMGGAAAIAGPGTLALEGGPTLADEVAYLAGIDASGRITATSYWSAYERITAYKFGAPTAGTGATASYAFDPASAFSATEQATFVRALAVWSAVADIRFTAAASAPGADILLTRGNDGRAFEQGATSIGEGATLGQHTEQAVISIDTSVTGFDLSGSLDAVGGYGFGTAVHEIGHAIGLGHGGRYNETARPSSDQFSAYDTALYTTMSYFSWADEGLKYGGGALTDWGYANDGYQRTSAHTAMQADILAARALYGVPTQTPFASAQVFGFHSTVTGPLAAIYNFAQNPHPVLTLESSALGNSLDLSGFLLGSAVTLTPGALCSVNGLRENVVIARDTWIDACTGGSGSDALTGNAHANRLNGGAGDDRLFGGDGNDVLSGGAGSDILDGGAGDDVSYVGSNASVSDSGGGFDRVYCSGGTCMLGDGIEVLAFPAGGDDFGGASSTGTTIYGNLGNDVLYGNIGDDVLFGGGGNDRLDGQRGVDRLSGAAGDDMLFGWDAGDVLIGGDGSDRYYVNHSGVVLIEKGGAADVDAVVTQLRIFVLPDRIEDLSYAVVSGVAQNAVLTGNAAANRIDAAGGDDVLDGGTGADRLAGGAGDDRYLVDDPGDTVIETAGAGHDTVVASVEFTLGKNVEDLTLTGAAHRGTGNELANAITGGRGADTLRGLAGNDMLIGGRGNDGLDGGDGADRLTGGVGIDVLTGGAGADRFVFGRGDTAVGASKADTITDFGHADADLIDLSAFASGDGALRFIGAHAFSGAGAEVRAAFVGGDTLVTGDLDGDAVVDFTIRLSGEVTLVRTDFLLSVHAAADLAI